MTQSSAQSRSQQIPSLWRLLLDVALGKPFLGLAVMLAAIDLMYPVTLTYDSGHFFYLARVLAGALPWDAWDPVRGVVFPLYLNAVTALLGRSSSALLVPMVLSHLLLFLVCCVLGIYAVRPASARDRTGFVCLVFLLVGIDPLVLGFYHVVLTEFLASVVAILACFAGLFLVHRAARSPAMLSPFAMFSLLVPFAWHLKQPYVGAALFPLWLASYLVILYHRERIVRWLIVGGNALVIALLAASILAWERALPASTMTVQKERRIWSYLERLYKNDSQVADRSWATLLQRDIDNYLAAANIYYWDIATYYADEQVVLRKDLAITRANENSTIGYRMFRSYGQTNLFYMPRYYELVAAFESPYRPPRIVNQAFLLLLPKSTVLFSTLYATLPVTFVVLLLFISIKRPDSPTLVLALLCSGSALANALQVAVMNLPNDRYLFWGYPLLLLALLLLLWSGGISLRSRHIRLRAERAGGEPALT